MKLVIADTGPLIHLHQADALDLLPKLGEIITNHSVLISPTTIYTYAASR